MALTNDLSNGFPPPFVASSLYRGSCFVLNNWLRSNIPRLLFLLKQRVEVSRSNLIVKRSWVPFPFLVPSSLAWLASRFYIVKNVPQILRDIAPTVVPSHRQKASMFARRENHAALLAQNEFKVLVGKEREKHDTNHANNVTNPDTKSGNNNPRSFKFDGNREQLLSRARTLVW